MTAPSPHLFRALHHLAESGYEPEADSAFALCRAANWSEPLARGTRHLDFRHGRSRLEYHVMEGAFQRVGWLIDRGGVEARVWDEEGGAPRWKLALFETSPAKAVASDVPRSTARAMLVRKVGGAPHGGFVRPPLVGPTNGFGPPIVGPLAAWRAAHPGALVANVQGRHDLVDADFTHLAGIKALNMTLCNNPGLSDAAFVHLRGLHTLWMTGCDQGTITDAAFAHLHGLHSLFMPHCNQGTITDAAFPHLRGVQLLSMRGCDQPAVTGATFASLRGVRLLFTHACGSATIAAAKALGLPVMD